MARCFLLQPPTARHDISKLAEFGRVVIVFNRGYFPDDVEQRSEAIRAILDEKLSDFSINEDYIVPMGDSCVVAAVTVWLMDNGYYPVSFLKYDKKLEGFYQIQIGAEEE